MKKELVNIVFKHNNTSYSARVHKHSPTAIILPNQTVLVTTCVVQTKGPRRSDEKVHVRQIFDLKGNLYPLEVLYQPGDWDRPLNIHFPIVSAEVQ